MNVTVCRQDMVILILRSSESCMVTTSASMRLFTISPLPVVNHQNHRTLKRTSPHADLIVRIDHSSEGTLEFQKTKDT